MRGAIEAFDFQHRPATANKDSSIGSTVAALAQDAQCQVLAHQQIGPAKLRCGIPRRRKFDNDVLAVCFADRAELRLVAAGRRSGQGAVHSGVCQVRIPIWTHGGRRARVHEAIKGAGAHNQISRKVHSRLAKRSENVVIRPMVRVLCKSQLFLRMGKCPAKEALGAHVCEKPQQTYFE